MHYVSENISVCLLRLKVLGSAWAEFDLLHA
jgi:hypothetical protein